MEKRGQKLTKRLVESLVPDPKRDYAVYDSEMPGFAVRVWPQARRSTPSSIGRAPAASAS